MKPFTQEIMKLVQDTSLSLPDLAIKIDALHDRRVKQLEAALRVARGYVAWETGKNSIEYNVRQGLIDIKTIDEALKI